jgi:hypothetical protein
VVVNNLLQPQSQGVFTSTPLLEILPEDENVNRAVTGYDPKDESRVCALFQKQGFCKRKFCSKDHEKLNPGKNAIIFKDIAEQLLGVKSF